MWLSNILTGKEFDSQIGLPDILNQSEHFDVVLITYCVIVADILYNSTSFDAGALSTEAASDYEAILSDQKT